MRCRRTEPSRLFSGAIFIDTRRRLGPRHRGRYFATPRFALRRWLLDRATSPAAILPRISYIRVLARLDKLTTVVARPGTALRVEVTGRVISL
jgi:hypothetical protein